jgi:hypothetical protein
MSPPATPHVLWRYQIRHDTRLIIAAIAAVTNRIVSHLN